MAGKVDLDVIGQVSNALLKQMALQQELEKLKEEIKAKQNELKEKKELVDANEKLLTDNKELVEILKKQFAAAGSVSSTPKDNRVKRGRAPVIKEDQKEEAVKTVLAQLKADKVERIRSSDFLGKCNRYLSKDDKPNDATFYKDAIEKAGIKSEGERRGKEFIIN